MISIGLFIQFIDIDLFILHSSLHLRQPVLEFKSSVFRPNLFYDIQFKELLDDSFVNLCQFIDETKKIADVYNHLFSFDIYFVYSLDGITKWNHLLSNT
jgi:hypothetical protein